MLEWDINKTHVHVKFLFGRRVVPPQDDGLNELWQDGQNRGLKDNLRRSFMIGGLPPNRWTCHHNFFQKNPKVWKKLKSENVKNERLLCKNNIIILLPTTFGCWCHFPRVGNLFFAKGCLRSNMVWMEKGNIARQGPWQ